MSSDREGAERRIIAARAAHTAAVDAAAAAWADAVRASPLPDAAIARLTGASRTTIREIRGKTATR